MRQLIPARRNWLLLALAGATLILAWLFVHFGSEVMEGELRTLDFSVRDWTMARQSQLLRGVFLGITTLGAKELLIPLGIVAGWWLFRHRRAGLIVLVFCALASTMYVTILKEAYGVERPAGGVAASTQFSFPSGHATGAAAIYFFLAFVAMRRGLRPALALATSTVLVIAVGVSRVVLDMHWASDVLGGWVVGIAFAVGCGALYEWIERNHLASAQLHSHEAALPAGMS